MCTEDAGAYDYAPAPFRRGDIETIAMGYITWSTLDRPPKRNPLCACRATPHTRRHTRITTARTHTRAKTESPTTMTQGGRAGFITHGLSCASVCLATRRQPRKCCGVTDCPINLTQSHHSSIIPHSFLTQSPLIPSAVPTSTVGYLAVSSSCFATNT